MANIIFGTQQDIVNRKTAFQTVRSLPRKQTQFGELWFTNGEK